MQAGHARRMKADPFGFDAVDGCQALTNAGSGRFSVLC